MKIYQQAVTIAQWYVKIIWICYCASTYCTRDREACPSLISARSHRVGSEAWTRYVTILPLVTSRGCPSPGRPLCGFAPWSPSVESATTRYPSHPENKEKRSFEEAFPSKNHTRKFFKAHENIKLVTWVSSWSRRFLLNRSVWWLQIKVSYAYCKLAKQELYGDTWLSSLIYHIFGSALEQ